MLTGLLRLYLYIKNSRREAEVQNNIDTSSISSDYEKNEIAPPFQTGLPGVPVPSICSRYTIE